MAYKVWLIVIGLFISVATFAQSDDLMVQGVGPNLYLQHVIKPKENLYSIGRLYNIPAKELAAYNKLAIEKPIGIGQQVKIPLTLANFSQNKSKGTDEVLVPVFHIVQDKEWLFRISANYNKVPLAYLQEWNNVTNDGLKAGMKLTIGYLKVKPGQSSLAYKGSADPRPLTPQIVTPTTTSSKKEEAVPVSIKEEVKPVAVEKSADPPPVPITEKKQEPTEPIKPIENTSNTVLDFKGGYFKPQFGESKKSSNGAAGIFKSVSGWNDGKYYALMNNVPAGTIVKIIAFATGKSVYAKVLGGLPEMRESIGLTVRVSDAAANELGAAHTRFNVEVKY